MRSSIMPGLSTPLELNKLLVKCISIDPESRPDFTEICSSIGKLIPEDE
jgi:hypothetical protein